MKTVKNFIFSLSPVKRRIAIYLNDGYTPEETAKKISKENRATIGNTKAFVTMVVQKAQKRGIKFSLKTVANHNDYVGEGKQTIRQWAGKCINEVAKKFNIKSGLILTLSCYECNMEQIINLTLGLKKFKFLSYEYNRKNFKQLVKNIKERNWDFMVQPIHKPIIHAIKKAKKDTYAHLLLDFCRSIKIHGEDIALALSKDIVKKRGLVWITVSARAGKGVNSYNALIDLVEKAGNGRYKLINLPNYVTSYRDSSPMVSIVVQRVK